MRRSDAFHFFSRVSVRAKNNDTTPPLIQIIFDVLSLLVNLLGLSPRRRPLRRLVHVNLEHFGGHFLERLLTPDKEYFKGGRGKKVRPKLRPLKLKLHCLGNESNQSIGVHIVRCFLPPMSH